MADMNQHGMNKPTANSNTVSTSGKFVLLHHTMSNERPENANAQRGDHYDLMLEHNGVLKTFALDEIPIRGKTIGGTCLPDHRIDYLHYEGRLSENRGSVKRIGQGRYQARFINDLLTTIRLDLGDQTLDLELSEDAGTVVIHVR